jgi:hypothetical protein
MLTAGGSLLTASFVHLWQMDQGFRTDHLLTLLFVLPESHYGETRPTFYRQYFEKVRALPGVEAVAGTINLPMTDSEGVTSFEIYGNPTPEAQRPTAAPSTISTQYFKTMEVPIIKGRDFTEDDNVATNPVIIISQSLAKKYFPGVDPIGKKLRPAGMPSEPVWMEIVGVVGDVRLGATQRDIESAMYFPAAQSLHSCCLYMVVRTRLDPLPSNIQSKTLLRRWTKTYQSRRSAPWIS